MSLPAESVVIASCSSAFGTVTLRRDARGFELVQETYQPFASGLWCDRPLGSTSWAGDPAQALQRYEAACREILDPAVRAPHAALPRAGLWDFLPSEGGCHPHWTCYCNLYNEENELQHAFYEPDCVLCGTRRPFPLRRPAAPWERLRATWGELPEAERLTSLLGRLLDALAGPALEAPPDLLDKLGLVERWQGYAPVAPRRAFVELWSALVAGPHTPEALLQTLRVVRDHLDRMERVPPANAAVSPRERAEGAVIEAQATAVMRRLVEPLRHFSIPSLFHAKRIALAGKVSGTP